MLTYDLLKNHAGVLLCGDYTTLKALHEVVHEVNDKSVLIRNKEGLFLGLAYDARKAYERQRRVIQPPKHSEEIGVRYGVEILWPVLLVQCRMLRASLAFFDSSKRQQSMAFGLEALLEAAIASGFGTEAERIKERWERIDPSHPWAEEKLDSRGAQFCAWTKAERKARLAGLLVSFDPMYTHYYEHLVRNGEKGLVPPDELDAWTGTEWADPRW